MIHVLQCPLDQTCIEVDWTQARIWIYILCSITRKRTVYLSHFDLLLQRLLIPAKAFKPLKVATYLSLSVSCLERRECSYFQRFLYKKSRTIRPTTFHFFLSTTFSINVVYRMGVYFYGRQEVWCYAGPTSGNFKVTANSLVSWGPCLNPGVAQTWSSLDILVWAPPLSWWCDSKSEIGPRALVGGSSWSRCWPWSLEATQAGLPVPQTCTTRLVLCFK
jgi:hypothetical protein